MIVLAERDEHGRVVLDPPADGDVPVGDLRTNVERYCRRLGITGSGVEAVYRKWKARADAHAERVREAERNGA